MFFLLICLIYLTIVLNYFFLLPIYLESLIFFSMSFNKPFTITTPVGDSVVAKRVHTNYPLMFPYRFTLVGLLEIGMVYFDVILGID